MLVDGEHYPPVVRAAVEELRAAGRRIVAAAMLGGTEKLRTDEPVDLGIADVVSGSDPLDALVHALDAFHPTTVIDLSDEPVLDPRTRLLLAAHAVARGVRYEAADVCFEVPARPRLATKPAVAVIGTGKRTGKTAVTAAAARILCAEGRQPVIVAMGRGGPDEPEVVDPAAYPLTPEALLALADTGRHAASDHLEDALVAGVVTVGTRRCGGGLLGAPASSTFARGMAMANARPESLLLLEGSGAVIPPVHADATLCVVPGGADPEMALGCLGAYHVLLSDGIVLTLVDEPLADSGAVSLLERRIRQLVPGVPVVRTTLRPQPLEPISGEAVVFATTAPEAVSARLAAYLESEHGADVVARTSNLANRNLLAGDLEAAPPAAVLVTELKAAAVDLATRYALGRGMRVVYCDNRVVTTGGDIDFCQLVRATADRATERFATPGNASS